MDDINTTLTRITEKVLDSSLPEAEKADIFAQLTAGMHRLVWPILLTHVPEYLLAEAASRPEQFTIDDYVELIDASLKNPATAHEIHDELKGALEEVDQLVTKTLG